MSVALVRKIARLKQKIVDLGPVPPGRITKQYRICGTPGRRGKDRKSPRKHGPYHNLSYTFRGQSRTLFLRRECVSEMRRRTPRYVQLKKLVDELIEASVELARKEVLARDAKKYAPGSPWQTAGASGGVGGERPPPGPSEVEGDSPAKCCMNGGVEVADVATGGEKGNSR